MTDAEWWLVLLTTSGWNDREIAKFTKETPVRVKVRFEALLDKLGLEDRLTLILTSFAHDLRIPRRIRHDFERGLEKRSAH